MALTNSSNVAAGQNAVANDHNYLRNDLKTGFVDMSDESWSYSSFANQVGVITVPSDARERFEVGDLVRITQSGSDKFFYVCAVAETSISVTAGSLYSLTNAAISAQKVSKFKNVIDNPLPTNVLITAPDGATVTFDLNNSKLQQVTLGGNRTLALSNVKIGDIFILRLTQDATGSRSVTWFSTVKWDGNVTPTLTTTANQTDVFAFICTGTNTYDGFILGQGIPA